MFCLSRQKDYLKFLFVKFWKNKSKFTLIVVIFLVFGIFFPFGVKGAEVESYLAQVVGHILGWIINLFGTLLLWEVKVLIRIAQYNSFVNSTAVTNGWVIVRDLCNMFFIVILLVIAIATILKVEMYHYKKLLGRLLIMAILINFSKTISGLIIDFAQVLTLTFVNGFAAAAGGNFVEALRLNKVMQIESGPGAEVTATHMMSSYILALLMIIVSCIVVVVMIVVFLMRIIMLWILIVLSPLAYFLTTFPQGQKYSAQWWSQFGNYVIVGPVMAFFLWLSLISVSSPTQADLPPETPGEEGERMQVALSQAGSEDDLIKFVIAIGMLVGGLVITQQMGVMGSSLAGGAVAAMRTYGMAAIKKPVGLAWKGTKAGLGYGAERFYAATGIELRPGKWAEAYKKVRAEKREERRAAGLAKAAERAHKGRGLLALAGAPETALRMGIGDVARLIRGGPSEARKKLQQSIEAKRKAARFKQMAGDPVEGYKARLNDDVRIAETKAAARKKEAEEIKEKPKLKKMAALENLQKPEEEIKKAIPDFEAKRNNLVAEIKEKREKEGLPPLKEEDYIKQAEERLIVEHKISEGKKHITDFEKRRDDRAKEIRKEREEKAARDPAYAKKIDDMIRAQGLTPWTKGADDFMTEQDKRQAGDEIIKAEFEGIKKDEDVQKDVQKVLKIEAEVKKYEDEAKMKKGMLTLPEDELEAAAFKEFEREQMRLTSQLSFLSKDDAALQAALRELQGMMKEILEKKLGKVLTEEEFKKEFEKMRTLPI